MLVGAEILELIYDLVGYVEVGCDFGDLGESDHLKTIFNLGWWYSFWVGLGWVWGR